MEKNEQKHWFELGRNYEKSQRIFLADPSFYIGLCVGFMLGQVLIELI